MTERSTPPGAASKGFTTHVGVYWGDEVLEFRRVEPGASFAWEGRQRVRVAAGGHATLRLWDDFEPPSELRRGVDASALEIAELRRDFGAEVVLPDGACCVLRRGALTLGVTHQRGLSKAETRAMPSGEGKRIRRATAFTLGVGVLMGACLGLSAWAKLPPGAREAERDAEHEERARALLARVLERELDDRAEEGPGRGGGAGARAKADEGAMGQPSQPAGGPTASAARSPVHSIRRATSSRGHFAATPWTFWRRRPRSGAVPNHNLVRPEEMLNYFDYRYEAPRESDAAPFAAHLDAAPSPYEEGHWLVRVGLQAKRGDPAARRRPGLLEVVARDVKVQVEMDGRWVKSYRLIGYENRAAADAAFRDRRVDGGEVGAGHSVTAVYDVELEPVVLASAQASWLTLHVRYKPPAGSDVATELVFSLSDDHVATRWEGAPASYRMAVAVAGLAEVLRDSPYAARWRLAAVEQVAISVPGSASDRAELVEVVQRAIDASGS